MGILTLLGKLLAKPGLEFVYQGLPKDCEGCRLRSSCDNLEPGLRYRVIGTKSEFIQECNFHHLGVVLVEVMVPNFQVALPSESARGPILRFRPQRCDNLDCEYQQYCDPPGVPPGKEYQLVKLGKSIPCPRSRELKLAEIRYRQQ